MVDDKMISDSILKPDRQHIKDWPATERPREKLLHLGPEGLSDGELLAVLLRIGKSGQSAEGLGRQLLSKFRLQRVIFSYVVASGVSAILRNVL